MILLERGGSPLVQQLAEDLAHEQTNRAASSTVGARFREQLRDLIGRLDKYAPAPSRPSCSTGHSAAAAYNDALTHLHRLASIAMVTSCGAIVHKLDNLLRLQATGWQPSQVAILYAKSAAALHA